MKRYFERSVGWMHDPSAVQYSCQVREIIYEVTNVTEFIRKGDFWSRNPEYGRNIDKAEQARWGGAFHPAINPYHYQRYQIMD
jgi:hypothetical protein